MTCSQILTKSSCGVAKSSCGGLPVQLPRQIEEKKEKPVFNIFFAN
jgi:hypothetical protein